MEIKFWDSTILQRIHPVGNATLQFLNIHDTRVLPIPQLPQSLSWLWLGQSTKSVLQIRVEDACKQLDGTLVRQGPNMCFWLLHIKNSDTKHLGILSNNT